MKKSFFFGGRDSLRPDPPGEPLYTFDEIADKLGMTPNQLRMLRMKHTGLTAWRSKSNNELGPTSRWRYSDARKWFNGIKDKLPS